MRPSKNEKLRILITGATGVYGAHAAKLCLDNGHEVFSIRRTLRPHDSASLLNLNDKITWIEGDIRDGSLVRHCLADWRIQMVAHFAALPIVSTAPHMLQALWSVNVIGTLCLLDAVRQYNRDVYNRDVHFLFVSTDKALGYAGDRSYTEDMGCNPSAPYDSSKHAAEIACLSYQRSGYVPNLVITRSCNVVAKADLNWRLLPNTIRQFICHVPAKIYTKGQWCREFIAVEDAVEAQLTSLLRADETPGEIFHIGSGFQWTQEEAIEYIRTKHFPDGHTSRVPPPEHSKIEIAYQTLDSSKIARVHGWTAKTPVDRAVDELVKWWKDHKELAPWSML